MGEGELRAGHQLAGDALVGEMRLIVGQVYGEELLENRLRSALFNSAKRGDVALPAVFLLPEFRAEPAAHGFTSFHLPGPSGTARTSFHWPGLSGSGTVR